MKKLQLALIALTVGGLFAAHADARCNKGTCYKKEKTYKKSPCKPCGPEECTEERNPRIETDETCETLTVKIPRKLQRECCDVKRTCVKQFSSCENGCWEKLPCRVTISCDDGHSEVIELD